MFGAHLLIPTQICDGLSCGQGKFYGQADGWTDGHTQATTMPLWPEKPQGDNSPISQWFSPSGEQPE